MPEPIVFISHFHIKEGKIEALRERTLRATAELKEQKPRTVVFLSYIDEQNGLISFLHAFTDSESMDLHFEGTGERAKAAYEQIEPLGWELYGIPSAGALETLRQAAASSGVSLTVHPEYAGGFLRVAPAFG